MTPERFKRITDMLAMRQLDLTVCLEEVHKPHNLAAIVRTADAIGIHRVHAVWPRKRIAKRKGTARGSQNWVDVKLHQDIHTAVAELKASGMQILATHLSESSVDFRAIDYTKPTAILLGQEKFGITDEALALADHHVVVPMVGMVQSLNVSVAAAAILYEAQRQRELAGCYTRGCPLDPEEQNAILFEGGHPIFARICKQKELPYPRLGPEGEILADEAWWQKVQMTRDSWTHLDDEEESLEE
ncbi:tRNA (guanosine(18)-2'-O)-methyltransferase TrmH [Aeromonas schubertii]|uniref:tRNA (guanosine(18)-2'-O)-methyltransferase n=1 Tax=Aeromonas schubertii TaxID=652 RepID=A0A0S2SFM7_9GAMM|nr:tRNA (guanosine(18)-2'-O)-methyltransferase TrmH [Aeromonas schubertii]ALP40466.1 tRNA guanosine-2'-O-methyltransferase [Aeromonas schubertii]MBZ6065917.1 tRNA (guanosine(18)-2'-O)-methyltransferase TrmH [Aeromonas schubertii]MBZ6072677.1 tRNA (guanosine(18)-2'-O)-methyltransferase TrmH [Aeromonas schubertii]QCG49746.1 tRNA (guanosine(18)-2'-O)-methyltransferase TrmH [Aeromonas schubertii]